MGEEAGGDVTVASRSDSTAPGETMAAMAWQCDGASAGEPGLTQGLGVRVMALDPGAEVLLVTYVGLSLS